MQRQRFEDRGGDGDGLWTGLADGRSDTEVLLTVKNGFMAGTIRYGEDVYEVRPTADGQVVERLDFNAFPSCAGGQPVQDLPADDGALAESSIMDRAGFRAVPVTAAANPAASLVLADGDPTIVDVMSVYTPQARAAAGGVAQIEAVIQAAVDAANQAFINSNIAMRYRLVRVAEVAYNDTGDISADLAWVRASADVAAMRDQSGADLVSLVVDNGGRYCGVGYVMRTVSAGFASVAFQVTVRSCAVGNLTFAHEHGHNLGMEHDPANSAPANQASYPWSFGHFVDAVFRTVMSYATVCPSGCRRIPYFSNPNVSYLGYPTGVANAFDNARTAGLTAPVVASFRTAPGAAVPAAPAGLNAVATSAGQINLTWTDTSANETGFKIERSTAGGSYTQIAALGPNFVAFADLTVTQSTAYSYRVRSYNANGDSAYSNLASATTPLPPPPLSPSQLVATAAGATQVNLTWADNSGNETGFRLERSANAAGFVELVVLPAGTTSFADSSASASTSYEYRVRASNAGGNSAYSNTATVTTPAGAGVPSAPSAMTAVAGGTQVNLSWTDTSSNEAGFKIERSADGGAFVQIATAGVNSTAYFDTAVSAGVAYAYRVRANNAAGDSGYSNTATVTLPSALPSAPGGLSAVVSGTQVNLSWTDTSSNETGFKIERSADGGAFAQIATAGANATAYFDTAVTAGAAYAYRVRANNASGDSGYSNTATVTLPLALPSAPGGLSAVVSGTQVNLSWTDTSSNETGFKIERSADGGAFVQIATAGVNATAYFDSAVTAGAAYAYRVRANNASGDSGYSNTATVTLPSALPSAPGGLSAVVSGTQVNLSWTDTSSNETGFKIERSADGGAFVQIATAGANANAYFDTAVTAGAAYAYRVRANNAAGDSGYSNTATVTLPSALPSAPGGLSAVAASATQVNLSWTDTSSNETGFKIERSASGGAFIQIATTGVNATAYFDTSVSGGIAYAYRVRANNATGDSGYSNTATVTTPAAPTAPAAPAGLGASVVSATQVNLTWADASSNETGFKVERSVNGAAFVQIALTGANATSFADLTTIAGTAYAYRVRAYNSVGDSAYSNSATANTPAAPNVPSAPAGLSATAVSSTQVNLAWADTASNETGFKVERSTNGGAFIELTVLGANAASFTDLIVVAGTSYVYRVRAYNGIGDSGYSNIATVTTPALQLPAAPTGLVATAVNALQVNLTWADNANNELGYKIERSTGARFAQIAVTGANATSFSDTTVSPGTLYFYRVRATNASGDSAYSVIYSVRTP